jgi:hypothetical protein
MSFHHRIGQHGLPFRDADSQDCQASTIRELPQAIGKITLALASESRDAMRRDVIEKAIPQVDALQEFQPVQQPIRLGRVVARLKLSKPYEPGEAIVNHLVKQSCESLACGAIKAIGYSVFDPAFRRNQGIGAKPFNRGDRRQNCVCPPAFESEPARKMLV